MKALSHHEAAVQTAHLVIAFAPIAVGYFAVAVRSALTRRGPKRSLG